MLVETTEIKQGVISIDGNIGWKLNWREDEEEERLYL